MRARTIRRTQGREEYRWGKRKLDDMRGLPWNTGRREAGEEMLEVMMPVPGDMAPTPPPQMSGPASARHYQ